MQSKQSVVKTANIERLHRMLNYLAGTTHIIQGWSLYKLTAEFNQRYVRETKPLGRNTIQGYIQDAVTAGWLY